MGSRSLVNKSEKQKGGEQLASPCVVLVATHAYAHTTHRDARLPSRGAAAVPRLPLARYGRSSSRDDRRLLSRRGGRSCRRSLPPRPHSCGHGTWLVPPSSQRVLPASRARSWPSSSLPARALPARLAERPPRPLASC